MPSWKRTFYAALVAQFCSITGFTCILPFMPLYIRTLGVAEGDAPLWAGVVQASAAVSLAVFSPFWGMLADRFGRKPMVLRSMVGGALALTLMSLTRTVGQLAACRVVQGMFTGTIAANTALVASVAPRERSGYALGMMQASVFVGASIGPFLGGEIAEAWGFTAAFLASAALLLVGAVCVRLFVHEEFTPPRSADRAERGTFGQVLAASGFLAAVFALLAVRFAGAASRPVFPFFVEQVRGSSEGLKAVTGRIYAMAGIAAALSARWLGRVGDSWGHKRLLVVSCVVAGAISLLHVFVWNTGGLVALRVLFGFAAGGMIPAANAIIRQTQPDKNIGKAYGVTSSLTALGWGTGALGGGFLYRVVSSQAGKTVGLRSPFVLTGILLGLTAIAVALRVRAHPAAAPHPQAAEAPR